MMSVIRKLAVLPAFLVKSRPWSAQFRACRSSRSTVLDDILGVFQNSKGYCSNKSTDKTGQTGSDAISKVCSGGKQPSDITTNCSKKDNDAASKSGSMLMCETFEKIGDGIKCCNKNPCEGNSTGPKVVSPKKLFEAKCGKTEQTPKCEKTLKVEAKSDQKSCDKTQSSPPCLKCRFVAKPAMKENGSGEKPCLKVDKKPRPRFAAIPAKSNCQKPNPKSTAENETKKCKTQPPVSKCEKKDKSSMSLNECDLPKPAKCVKKKPHFKAKSGAVPSASSQNIDKCKPKASKCAKPKPCSVPTTVKPQKCSKPKSAKPKSCDKSKSGSKTDIKAKTSSTSKCIKSKTPEPIKCSKSKSADSANADKSKPVASSEPSKPTESSKCDKPTKPTKPKCDTPKPAEPPKCEKPKPVEPIKCDAPKPVEPATCGMPKPKEPAKCEKPKPKCDKPKSKKTKCAKPKTSKTKVCSKTKAKPTSLDPPKPSKKKCDVPKPAEPAKCEKPKAPEPTKCAQSKSVAPEKKEDPKPKEPKTADTFKCDKPKPPAEPPKCDKPKPQESIKCDKDKPAEPAKCADTSRAAKTKSICDKLKDVDVSKCETKAPEKPKDPKVICQKINAKKEEASNAECKKLNLAGIAATAAGKPTASGPIAKKVGGNISSGAPCGPKKSPPSKIKMYRNISLATILLVMVFCGYTFLHIEHTDRPEFKAYEHLRRRNKRFPWGDGQKSFFHNPEYNALPEGYEDETDDVD